MPTLAHRLLSGVLVAWAGLVVLLGSSCHPRGSDRSPGEPPVPEATVVARLDPEGVPPWSQGPPLAEPGEPRLVDFGPEGAVDRWPRIYLRFDRAIDPPPEDAPAWLALEPAVPGRVVWIDRYQAVFQPAQTLAPGHAYTVVAQGELSTSDGHVLELDRRWRFEVDRTEVEIDVIDDEGSVYGSEDGKAPQVHWKARAWITVDRPATLSAMREHTTVRVRPRGDRRARPRPLPVRLRLPSEQEWMDWGDGPYDDESAFIVEPRDHWPADSTVEIEVDAGLRGVDDVLGPEAAVVARLETPRGLEVEASCARRSERGCEPAPVFLEFSSPIPARYARKVRVSPRPEKLRVQAEDAWEGAIEQIVIKGHFEPGQRYSIRLAPGVRDVYSQPLAEPWGESFEFVLPAPELRMSDRYGFLPAGQPTTVGIEARWVERARLRVAVLEDEATLSLLGHRHLRTAPFPREGVVLTERDLSLDPQGDLGWSSVPIDLADFIGTQRRAVFVEVVPLSLSAAMAGRTLPRPVRGLYQVTDLGVLALTSSANATARVAQLSTGAPLADARVQLFHTDRDEAPTAVGKLRRSDVRGLLPLPRWAEIPQGRAALLVHDPSRDDHFVARLGRLTPPSPSLGPGLRPGERVLASVVTERPLYRPGEKVRVVGWAAVSTPHTPSGLRPARARSPVVVELLDGNRDVVTSHEVALTEYGKFWATLRLPPRAPLGSYEVRATGDGMSAQTWLRLREFRTPSFSVTMASDQGDYLHGSTAKITAGASYYFGGPVPIASARRHESCATVDYRPPGLQSDWVVGYGERDEDDDGWGVGRGRALGRGGSSVEPDQEGRLRYSVDLSGLDPSWPHRCTASLGLQDAAAAEVGVQTSFMVHPSRYLLLRSPPWSLEAGDAIHPAVRVVNAQGERLPPAAVEVMITRRYSGTDARGRRVRRHDQVRTCRLRTTTSGPDPQCSLSGLEHGRYDIVARTTQGVPKLEAQTEIWVERGWEFEGEDEDEDEDALTLELSNPEPRPGETLGITVRSSDRRGQGLLTFMHGGLRTVEPFTLKEGRFEHAVEVTDAWIPGMAIEAILVRQATPQRRSLVERARAHARVAADGRVLTVEVQAPDTAGPQQAIPIDVFVRDAAGRPTAGHVALWAVDEAILALEEPRIPDLVHAFVVRRGEQTELHEDYRDRLHPYVRRPDPFDYGETMGLGNIGMIGKGGGGGTSSHGGSMSLRIREDLETTPIFLGDVEVDERGRARVEGTLPDNLTTFRITAIASAELPGGDAIGRFGHADTRVRVTAPLVVQAALPRHLRPGDTAEVAALVDNLGGPAGTVNVRLAVEEPEGAVAVTSASSRSVPIEAGAQARVPFELKARAVGRPAITLTAELVAAEGEARLGDALRTVVPVEEDEGLERQVAVYGAVDDDRPVAVAIEPPTDVRPGSGRLDVTLGSTRLGGAEDMIDGLITYPYGCVEQTASRLLPLAALGTLAKHYPLGVGDLDGWVDEGIARLRSMQVGTGGLAYWPRGSTPHAYATAYAAWVLQLLAHAGYEVPPRFVMQLHEYLLKEIPRWASHGTPTVEDDLRLAMALVALAASGRAPDEPLASLFERRERLPRFGQALLSLALHAADPRDPRNVVMTRELLDDLDEREGVAHVRDDGRWLGALFDSGPRTEAMVLLALLRAVPDDGRPVDRRLDKLVRGLMELRRAGALRNTQERAYALLALGEYARRFEAEIPAFDTAVWVDADFVGRGRFEGRSADVEAYTLALPWAEHDGSEPDGLVRGASARGESALVGPKEHRVTLSRTGQGRMVYRVAMRWAPEPSTIAPHAAGIALERSLRSAAGPLVDGEAVGHGELVALDLTLTTQEAMTYVAVDIPLPAGLEAVDTTIGQGRRAMVLSGVRGYWVTHTELRTERVLLFADRLSPGEHRHTIHLRAVTPGRYTMPPARAEAMYYPEVQGNTAARVVEIRP